MKDLFQDLTVACDEVDLRLTLLLSNFHHLYLIYRFTMIKHGKSFAKSNLQEILK